MAEQGGSWTRFVDENERRFESPYEKLFVERVLSQVPNLDPGLVSMQTTFRDSKGVNRRIDFTVVDGPVRLALEVDGYDKTGRGSGMTLSEFIAWSERELEMSNQGWKVLRFANSLVKHHPDRCARDIELNLIRERDKFDRHAAAIGKRKFDQQLASELRRLEKERLHEIDELEALLEKKDREAREATARAEEEEYRRRQAEGEATIARERQQEYQREATISTTENRGMKIMAGAMVVIVLAFVGYLVLLQQSPPGVSGNGPTADTPPVVAQPRAAEPVEFCAGAIPWDSAGAHVGESVALLGPVIDGTYARRTGGQPTYLNVGRGYPDPGRLVVLIWGDDRSKFPEAPEQKYRGRTVCIRGEIQEYRGQVQVVANGPEDLELR